MAEFTSLKQRIHAGETVAGVWGSTDLSRGQLAALVEKGPYDFVFIDGQHAAVNEEKLVAFCALAEELEIAVQFRIPHTRLSWLTGRYLDLGATSIMVPEVEDEATVDEAVAYFYYPPMGRRSAGGAARRGVKARGAHFDRLDYARWWNRYGVLCIQLESVAAVTRARQLAKAGVDVLAFGPNDLRFSLEGHPHHPFKTVDDCIAHVAAQLQGSTTRLWMTVTSRQERDRYGEMGVTVFLFR